jgi:hypothetical protein
MVRGASLIALSLLLGPGCAHRRAGGGADLSRVEKVIIEGAEFHLSYSNEDGEAVRQLKIALERAVKRTRRWGGLPAPVAIAIHPTHEALERAVGREGYSWLRAWARYRTIDIQSPRTWSIFGAGIEEISELITHELTHCVMYQASGSEWTWAYKSIPLWFREGMASVSADQGYRRAGPDDLWRFYREEPSGDPIADPEPLYQSESEVVYGAAHWAFQFLVDRYGEAQVRAILRAMGEGQIFGTAFRDAIGLTVEAFEADFKRYVILQGWR